jgi:aryl-alcohol dehydrogenase-like predicted oxidoreductase
MRRRRMMIANLEAAEIKRIQQMEESMGSLIVALEPHYPLAELNEEQVSQLRKLEEELGVVLIAYQG